MMKATLSLIAASLALLGGIFSPAVPALAFPSSSTTTADNMIGAMPVEPRLDVNSTMNASDMWAMFGQMKFGMISSIQNNDQGQPGWIASGYWILRNDTGTSNTTTSSSSSNITDFYAMFHMAMLDGSALHSHEIYNFTQTGDSSFDASDNSTTVTGTATVTMREGPVNDVGTTIRISNDHVIAISLDSDATENHFGNTPIYGMAVTPEMLGDMSMGMNTTTSSTMGSMNGTMGNHWMGNNSTNGMMYGGMPK
jgi:hypothetical protein